MSARADSVLPPWGHRARQACRFGTGVFGAILLIGWTLRGIDWALNPALLGDWARPVLGVPALIAVATIVVGGAVWLVAELTRGFRD